MQEIIEIVEYMSKPEFWPAYAALSMGVSALGLALVHRRNERRDAIRDYERVTQTLDTGEYKQNPTATLNDLNLLAKSAIPDDKRNVVDQRISDLELELNDTYQGFHRIPIA